MQHINKILVIGGDDIGVFILQKFFSSVSISPVWVHFTAAWDVIAYLAQTEMPGLIFLEPKLPDMPDEQFLETLHKLNIFTRSNVCLLTTFPQPGLEPLGSEYAILKRFTKPFTRRHLNELLTCIKVA